MAFYQCTVPVGSLDADTRAALAEAITTVHSAVIGVPAGFVNVVFTEYDPTAFYTGGRPNAVSAIHGILRAGHESTVRGELLTRLAASWSSITGHQTHEILVCLTDVDPGSHMEAGMILPDFGEEAVWTHQHSRELEGMHRRQQPQH
jgi:phenylpyruvate tautomerase PptA (4-oxalocrotonate tautomerase family)